MNGTIPATVNSSEGSGDTSETLGTTVCPRFSKCSRKRRRISAVCMREVSVLGRTNGVASRPMTGSALRGVGAATGQLYLAAVGQRCVQAGAGADLVLP